MKYKSIPQPAIMNYEIGTKVFVKPLVTANRYATVVEHEDYPEGRCYLTEDGMQYDDTDLYAVGLA